jgi:rod shape-determining protein MreD
VSVPWRTLNRAERIDWLLSRWRLAVPAAVSALGTLALTAPIFPPVAALPHVPLLTVLVWCTYRPSLMPPAVAFLLGLLADPWLGLPIGINATLLPAVALVLQLLDRRFPERPFVLDWALALPLTMGYQLAQCQLLQVVGLNIDIAATIPQGIMTWVAYPAVAYAAARINRRWLEVV